MRLESAFRALLLEHYPQAPHVADMVTLHAMQASFPEPRSPAEQAAHEAYDMLKAAILDGRIALEGCLENHLCGPIGAAEITTRAQINVFGSTVHIRHGRTYHDVSCSADDVAALISRLAAAPVGVTRDRPVTRVEACRPLIEAPGASTMRRADILTRAQNEIPGLLVKEFDAAWEMYASKQQRDKGRRKRQIA